ncbi:hypothetical protein Dm11a5_0821 [Dehalococcoides mccartyi]|uniref:Uncharacterized protein n=1 Tax=Dehalococcoides mccartyi TaxID=61435 RepID=A0A142VBD2_9CHLR|nr:hypothetical protein btf_864 [Dehalococcoides mccartyi BTF08]AMU86647.1 hypothetical protein Dm11a5_0821 [Dehalococcoides mccartyi]
MEIFGFLFFCLYAGFALGFACNWKWQKPKHKRRIVNKVR